MGGISGPAGLPADIISKLSASINRIVSSKEVANKLTSMGADVSPVTFAGLGAYMNQQYIV